MVSLNQLPVHKRGLSKFVYLAEDLSKLFNYSSKISIQSKLERGYKKDVDYQVRVQGKKKKINHWMSRDCVIRLIKEIEDGLDRVITYVIRVYSTKCFPHYRIGKTRDLDKVQILGSCHPFNIELTCSFQGDYLDYFVRCLDTNQYVDWVDPGKNWFVIEEVHWEDFDECALIDFLIDSHTEALSLDKDF